MKSPVLYPCEESEAEIQFFILYELRKLKLDARAEVRSRKCMSSRFDVVVFIKRQAVLLIEVKKKLLKSVHPSYRKKDARHVKSQREKYEGIGLPLDWVHGMKEAVPYIRTFAAKHPYLWNAPLAVQGIVDKAAETFAAFKLNKRVEDLEADDAEFEKQHEKAWSARPGVSPWEEGCVA